MVWPGKSILVAAVLFGAYLLVGIAQVVFALTLDVSAGSRVLLFISGALSVVLGVLAFRHFSQVLGVITVIAGVVVLAWPFDSIFVLAIVAGAWLVVVGISQIVWAFKARRTIHDIEKRIERPRTAA